MRMRLPERISPGARSMLGRDSRLLATHPTVRPRLGATQRRIAAACLLVPILTACCLVAVRPASAQPIFGQNKIQYADFTWRVMATPHLDLHFYPDERELAEWVAKVGEEAVVELMAEMEIDPAKFKKRIP